MPNLDRIAHFMGQIARPFAIIWTALCAGVGTLILAFKLNDPVQSAVFIGAVYTVGLSPIFIGKAVEERGKAKSAADVEIARSTGAAPGPQEVVVTNTPDAPVPVDPAA